MKNGGGRTLGTGKEGIGVAQKLVGSEVPRRVLYRVDEAVVLLGLSRASCTNSSDQAGYRRSQKDAANTSCGDRRVCVAADGRS
jgi:hypothetical protein